MQSNRIIKSLEDEKCSSDEDSTLANLVSRPVDRIGAILEAERRSYVSYLSQAAPDIESIVEGVARRFFRKIESDIRTKDLESVGNLEAAIQDAILRSGEQLYHSVGEKTLGPLVVRFAERVLSYAPNGATVAFLARDAEPYFEAAKILYEHSNMSEKNLNLRYVTLNRQHFRIYDENLKKEQSCNVDERQEELKNQYLKQEFFNNPLGVVIVDTGCWGSMIEKMWEAKARREQMALHLHAAFFMYSYNPNIYGFVNDVAANTPNLKDLALRGVFISDTFECLPKSFESSSQFSCNKVGIVTPDLISIESNYLGAWHQSVLAGIRSAAAAFVREPDAFPTPSQALMIVEEGRIKARDEFTGVLPQATPKWSGGEEFLRKWQLSPITPQNDTSV